MEVTEPNIYASYLRTLNKSARWETTHRDGMHKVKPSGQREDKSVQTSYASLTKDCIIKVSRNSATPVSSTNCPSRKHSHVNPSAKETPNLSNGGEGSSKDGTKAPCRRSQQIAALHRAKNQATEEHEVIALSNDSKHEKDKNLEVGVEEALLAAEDGAEETLPKNDVYAALWAMLDAESENEAEEILGQWDLDDVLNKWGKIEPEVGPAENDQGPPAAAN
ncbi:hypothetical protein PIB30_060286 [Stylosanthes scabra]|uniref:Uncharacterized protein n=1 Tax=Stylosanthes scabra TaxID=79078 RepID=A0ABU6UJ95_9FABA|nr:hypothetical protein [Stylosanthes scabra]